MSYRKIRVFQFRNLQNADIDLSAPEVFLVGENGQGKTNLIEAIYMLSYGSSFRTRKDDTLIANGQNQCALSGWLDSAETVTIRIGKSSSPAAKREIKLNEKTISDRKELIEHTPCIVFCHDDIEFVRGAPDMQRWFFNQTLSLFDPAFIDRLRTYTRILKLRNAVLKTCQEGLAGQDELQLLDVYDAQLAAHGIRLIQDRVHATAAFNGPCGAIFRKITRIDHDLLIRYRPSWKGPLQSDEIIASLRNHRKNDIRMGTTTSGPHRDRFQFSVDSRDFTQYASTGQLRLMSLILRVAQARFYAEQTGRKPVLLLDDVLLELDRDRRVQFLEELPEYEQAFFTFLPDEQYSAYRKDNTLIYRVNAGEIRHGTV